jgi:PAS domain S-box-containing protein
MSVPGSELRRVRSLIADLDAIVWEADASSFEWLFVSEGATEILGHQPRDWLAQPTFWADHLHPEDRERVMAVFTAAAIEGTPFDIEYRIAAKDGTYVWLRDLGHVVRDGDGRPHRIRGLMVEITGTKHLEAQRLEAESRFRRVVERLPAIVYIEGIDGPEDEPGRLRYVSPQVREILGFSPEEWIDDPQAWARQFHADDRARVRTEFDRASATGEPFSADYRMLHRDGREIWFHDEAVLVRDETGAPLFWQGIMVDVSRQREAESRAIESEARYRSLVEQLPVVVYSEPVVGNEVITMYISSRIEEVLGVSAEEWIRDPELWYTTMHPDDRERVRAENARTEASGMPFSAEYRSVARDGRIVWFRDEARLVRDAAGVPLFWQGVMFDVTAERETRQLLSEAEARFRALVEHTPAITYIDALAGPDPAIYISPQTTEVLGYTPEEWYADPDLWSRIVHPEDNNRNEHVDEEGIHSSEYRMIAKDGSVVWVHDQSSLITDDEGNPRFWQGVLVDVTQQKRTEQLEQDLAVERETAQRLRDLDELKNTFLQAVSHDLRTPLAAILGLAVTLGRDDLDMNAAETQDMARRIAVNARKLDRLVNDLLDLDRLSRGIVEPSLRSTDLGALIRNLVGESDLIAERRVNLEAQPVTIPVDAAKVERIVENLLANSARHTPVEAQLWVRVEPMGSGALIVVEDDGPGVPEDERERIFEPFLQGPSPVQHSPGVGIGLTLVARFAELHGGRAWVQERPGGGASFRVYLSGTPANELVDAGPRTSGGGG